MIDHTSFSVSDYQKSKQFYDQTFAELGYTMVMEIDLEQVLTAGYGKDGKPVFWIDDATRKQLEHGQRLVELLKQKQYQPLNVGEMAISFYVAEKGYFNNIPNNQIVEFEAELLDYVRENGKDVIKAINDKPELTPENDELIKGLIEAFMKQSTWSKG